MSGLRRQPDRPNLVAELTAARQELAHRRAQGDTETAMLLGAWIDTLLDEWNRRRREGCGGNEDPLKPT